MVVSVTMYYVWTLWSAGLFLAIVAELDFAEPQLPEGIDFDSSSSKTVGDWDPEGIDSTSLGYDTLGDSYLDSTNLDANEFTISSSSEPLSLLSSADSLDSVQIPSPQGDTLADEFTAADCSSDVLKSRNAFQRRQTCIEKPQIHPETLTPQKGDESKDGSFPENLGLFEPYVLSAYGEKDEEACPRAKFGDRVYSVCDSGQRTGNMLRVDQYGYVYLQLCTPGTSASESYSLHEICN